MDFDWKERTAQLLRVIFIACILCILWIAIKLTTALLYPFVFGFIIAYFINRPVTYLHTVLPIPRWMSVVLILLLFILVMFGLLFVFITQVVVEIGHLISIMPTHILSATELSRKLITNELITNFYERLQSIYSTLDDSYKIRVEETIGVGLSKIAQVGTKIVNGFLGGLQAFFLSLPNAATVIVISLLAAFFISKDFPDITQRMLSWVPHTTKTRLGQVTAKLRCAFLGFVKAQFTIIGMTAFITIAGLLILRVEYAFTIGLITGLVDLLPVLGTGTVFIPWIVYQFIIGNHSLVISLSILYGFIIIFRQIMEPKIVAENVGLDPLLTLIALFVGLQLFGIAGLIIGPVTVVILQTLLEARIFGDVWKYIVHGNNNKT